MVTPTESILALDQWLMSRMNRWLIYGSLFSLAIVVRISCFTGLIASDDLGYSYFGQLLARGTYDLQHTHLGLRVGLTIPLGLAYKVFGVSEWTTVLVPLLTSAVSVPLLVEVARRLIPARGALLAGLLLMTFPIHVRYATILVPEPVLEFLILLGVLAYIVALQGGKAASGFLAGLCFGASYLTKEAGLLVGTALILYSLARRQWRLMLTLIAGMATIGLLETAYYLIQTGDWLYRPHMIAIIQTEWYAGQTVPLAWRLLKEYPRAMLVPGVDFGLHSLISLALAAIGLFFIRGNAMLLPLFWAVVPGLYLNFGSASLHHYLPVPEAPRYIGLIYAPVFILAGAVLHRWLSIGAKLRLLCWGMVFLVVTTGFSCALFTRGQGYRTNAVARLRLIENAAANNHLQVVRVEGPDAQFWRCSMDILSGIRSRSFNRKEGCLVIQPDAVRLPCATEVRCTQQQLPLASGPYFPF